MPIYEYHCNDCNADFEKLVFGSNPEVVLRKVRLTEDGEAHVTLRHGQVFKQFVISFFRQKFRLRRLFFLILRRVQVIAS